jgi:hypothetical protein
MRRQPSRPWIGVMMAAVFGLFLAGRANAQTATIVGDITDSSGDAASNVNVTVIH